MSPDIKESAFETAIETILLSGGPDEPVGLPAGPRERTSDWGDFLPGGYRKRLPEEYDRAHCIIQRDLLDFVITTQPKEWERLKQHHGAEVKDRFIRRVAREIGQRGTLDVIRKGIKDSGCRFTLAWFRPSSGLNEVVKKLYEGNIFSVVRQLVYSAGTGHSLDLALFLNGLPLFTAELKNPLTGQDVQNAVRQYRFDRNPKEPLFAFGRCLAHFAVDPDLVFMTTKLAGAKTTFLPFNRGRDGGAGNPPVSPARGGYPTSYLWEYAWSRDSVLDLLQNFVQGVEDEDDRGRPTGKKSLIFPRYHQLEAVRGIVDHARHHGPGQRYLIQHSAGSGKSNSIAWLAHRLGVLHDSMDRRVFDSIIIITDRKVLDRQLQRTVRQFQQVDGVVENIDQTSRQLREALESGKTIIVTTLQKFPVIADQVAGLPGKRFAVIVDEAHSSQSGESTRSLRQVLSAQDLEKAAQEEEKDQTPEEELEDALLEVIRSRGRLTNVSYFAFTATPKPKTMELFGRRREDGKFEAFSLYSMRQAIEERFILDVLENYTTYKVYWKLLKKVAEDPRYDKEKAAYLLRSFVDLHPHAIKEKIGIMVQHFNEKSASRIGGKAKAMIVTRSRLHAVRYKLALDAYLKGKGLPFKAMVAFSGTVRDGGADFTEAGMNGFPEAQTAKTFERPEYRFLVVANKFQTGFDQPLLHTMYVDKKLGGVNAVQTLSRLNRIHPEKQETAVLDFTNEAEDILKAFEPYYEKTILSESTDPNLLYDLELRLADFHVYGMTEIDRFAALWLDPATTQDQFYALLKPCVDRFEGLTPEEQTDFRSQLTDFVRLYSFLAQIITFADTGLEKLYLMGRLLRRYLPWKREELPKEIQQKIDMETYRIRETSKGKIALPKGGGEIEPLGAKATHAPGPDEQEALSRILKELNDRFGTDFSTEDRVFIEQLEVKLAADESLRTSVRVNPAENARLAFDHKVSDHLQDMVDTNFQFYKRVTDDKDFSQYLLDRLFARFRATTMMPPPGASPPTAPLV